MTEDVFQMHYFLSSGLKCCPSLLVATGIGAPSWNFRNHFFFFLATSKNSPTAACVFAADFLFNYVDFFRYPINLLKQILNCNLLYSVINIIIIIIAVITLHSKKIGLRSRL
jgi:hypothetical protein